MIGISCGDFYDLASALVSATPSPTPGPDPDPFPDPTPPPVDPLRAAQLATLLPGSEQVWGVETTVALADLFQGGVAPLRFDATPGAVGDGVWRWTPTSADVGRATTIAIAATDAAGTVATASAVVQVTAFEPTLFGAPALDDAAATEPRLTLWILGPGGTTAQPLPSPHPYFPAPVRLVAGEPPANWSGVSTALSLVADRPLFVAAMFKTPVGGPRVRLVIQGDPDYALQSHVSVDPTGAVSIDQVGGGIGRWIVDGPHAPALIETNGYYVLRATLAPDVTTAATLRITGNASAAGDQTDVFRVGAASGALAPILLEAPTISEAGTVLSASVGRWTGEPPPTFAFAWTLDGEPIVGADRATVDTASFGEGLYMCAVTATNTAGSTTTATAPFRRSTAYVPPAIYRESVADYADLPTAQAFRVSETQIIVEWRDGVRTDGDYNEATQADVAGTLTASTWAAASPGAFNAKANGSPVTVSGVQWYSVPQQVKRISSRTLRYRALVTLASQPSDGATLTLWPNGVAEGNAASLVWGERALSGMVQVPDVGFTPGGRDKRALVGRWCGAAVPFANGASRRWGLWNETAGAWVSGWSLNDWTAARAMVRERLAGDTFAPGSTDPTTTQHEVWLADFSAFQTPGRYRVVVEGCGASKPFDIHAQVYAPMGRFIGRGFGYMAHGDSRAAWAKSSEMAYPREGHRNTRKRIAGRTFASWGPDGLSPGSAPWGKLWDNNASTGQTSGGLHLREQDATLNAFPLADILYGYRDAADQDVRALHLWCAVEQMTLALWAHHAGWSGDMIWGRPESPTGPAPHRRRILGAEIVGSRVMTDMDHAAMWTVDAFAQMQLLDAAGTWTPGSWAGWINDARSNACSMPTGTPNWALWRGSVRGGFEVGGYGVPWNFRSWASSPVTNDVTTLYGCRPDPVATLGASAAFATAALRFRQVGDAAMEAHYSARATAAYNWGVLHLTTGDARITHCHGKQVYDHVLHRNTWQARILERMAHVAYWALTGDAAAHGRYLSDGGAASDFHSAALYTVTQAAGLRAGHDAGRLAAIATAFGGQIDTHWGRRDQAAHQLFGAMKTDIGNYRWGNSYPAALQAPRRYGLALWFAGLSATQRQRARALIEAEVATAAGRWPTGRPLFTGMGRIPPLDVAFYDWQFGQHMAPPPGIARFGNVSNQHKAGDNFTPAGFRVNGTEETQSLHLMPAVYRDIDGQVGNTAQEFEVNGSQAQALFGPWLCHGLQRAGV